MTDQGQYEMIEDDTLPDHPTPLVVADKEGRPKWTISIPSSFDFPLQPEVYNDICGTMKEARDMVLEIDHKKKKTHQAHYDYYHVDPNYMDVAEAVESGLLPKPGMATLHGGFSTPGDAGNVVGQDENDLIEAEACSRTMTFVMETGDAGMGPTLMMLWTAYGLSQKEGRDFFVDDSRW